MTTLTRHPLIDARLADADEQEQEQLAIAAAFHNGAALRRTGRAVDDGR